MKRLFVAEIINTNACTATATVQGHCLEASPSRTTNRGLVCWPRNDQYEDPTPALFSSRAQAEEAAEACRWNNQRYSVRAARGKVREYGRLVAALLLALALVACAAPAAVPFVAVGTAAGTSTLTGVVAAEALLSMTAVVGTVTVYKELTSDEVREVADAVGAGVAKGDPDDPCRPRFLRCGQQWSSSIADTYTLSKAVGYCWFCLTSCRRRGVWPQSVPLEPTPFGDPPMAFFDPGPVTCH